MNTGVIGDLISQLENMVQAVSFDSKINNADLRRILRFISKVTQVVNQAFQNIYPILIEISFLKDNDLQSGKIDELWKEVHLLASRDYYRDVEFICGQLYELSMQYDDQIAGIISKSNAKDDFREIFMLLQHEEGYIVDIMQSIKRNLDNLLDEAIRIQSIQEVKEYGSREAQRIKDSLTELQLISNKILGLSGKEGFLELTETDRLLLQDKINYEFNYVDKRITTGNISGKQIAIGEHISQNYEYQNSNLNKEEVIKIIDELINEIRNERLPLEMKQKVTSQLEVSKAELEEAKPDKDYIGKNIEKVTETLKKTGGLINEASSIGQKIIKIASWVGHAVSWMT